MQAVMQEGVKMNCGRCTWHVSLDHLFYYQYHWYLASQYGSSVYYQYHWYLACQYWYGSPVLSVSPTLGNINIFNAIIFINIINIFSLKCHNIHNGDLNTGSGLEPSQHWVLQEERSDHHTWRVVTNKNHFINVQIAVAEI